MSLYLKLEDASALLFSDGTRVASYEAYLGWHAEQIQRRGLARVWWADTTLRAEVNHGRWIAYCAACRHGIFTHPTWRLACCAECGAIYRGVEFPAEIDQLTRVLLERPRRENQNWAQNEPMWKLRLENTLHGVPC